MSNITFSIIKPDAVGNGKTGPILAMINEAGFRIVSMKMLRISKAEAEAFYDIHRERSFFPDLVEFMTSGPVVVMVLQHENAVAEFRKLIGATDPAKAEQGTVRKLFATSVQMNAVHGSDSDDNAKRESNFFFSEVERFM